MFVAQVQSEVLEVLAAEVEPDGWVTWLELREHIPGVAYYEIQEALTLLEAHDRIEILPGKGDWGQTLYRLKSNDR